MEQYPQDLKPSAPDWSSLLEKAQELYREGNIASARSICAEVLIQCPDQPDALHLMGILAHRRGRTEEAVMHLRSACKVKPSDLNLYKNLILMLKEMDQMSAAAEYCEKILQCDSDNYQIYQGLGDLFFRSGFSQEAVAFYEKALSINPIIYGVWGNLGSALQDCNRLDDAIVCYQNALVHDPANADLYYNMGIAFSKIERSEDAISNFEKALVLDPHHSQALFNLGNAFKSQGRLEKAVDCYQKCIRLNADDIDAHHNLANAFYAMGQLTEAMDGYTRTLHLKPDHILALNNMACLLKDLGADAQAISMLRRANEIAPNDASAYVNLGHIYKDRNETAHAIEAYQKAQSLAPNDPDIMMHIGRLCRKEGAYDEGLNYLKQAVTLSPDISNAWWYYYLSLPILYKDESEIERHRKRLSDNIGTLIRRVRLDTPERCRKALAGIGSYTNFYLQYQGRNDLVLQKKYGEFVHRVMKANFPQWATAPAMPVVKQDGKIRIGYLSSFMRAHTVGYFLMGWLEHHDPSQFEVNGYYIGAKSDDLTRTFEQKFHRFRHIPGNIEAMAKKIRNDELHILIYTDIGMFAPATQLAGLRLAPIQCKGWGHPVTTGLPTIDFYLSAELMETTGAAAHYSETLVLLPNLALALKPPQLPEIGKSRQQFGLNDHDFVYLTSQSLFKYLPQFDEIYPRIAVAVENARFVFISNPNPVITDQFKKRIQSAFNRYDLSMDRFCVFQPRLSPEEFMCINQVSDVLLDPISWSGGKTTLEGLSCDLPVVTCPGPFMRGRHAYAMLKMLQITDTIAADVSSYIDIASRLGNDKAFYDHIRNAIVVNRHRLYNDQTCIRALEAFYRNVVGAQIRRQEKGGCAHDN